MGCAKHMITHHFHFLDVTESFYNPSVALEVCLDEGFLAILNVYYDSVHEYKQTHCKVSKSA